MGLTKKSILILVSPFLFNELDVFYCRPYQLIWFISLFWTDFRALCCFFAVSEVYFPDVVADHVYSGLCFDFFFTT